MEKFAILMLGLLLWNPSMLRADEPVHNPEELKARGFSEADRVKGGESPGILSQAPNIPWVAHTLPWPVQFQDAAHTLGNAMNEFQPFGSPYFHGGCDLRVAKRAQVVSPVAGKLEAGHYDYTNNPDGSMTKYFKPWPASGDSTYFEVAVVTPEGNRFEFHHMNRDRLPKAIVDLLNQGGAEVAAGTLLGEAIVWPGGDYHHIHYNVIDPHGVRINPEFVSPLIVDTQAPQVKDALAVFPGGRIQSFGTGTFQQAPQEFVVAVVDRKDGNSYEQPPVLAEVRFDSGAHAGWDFSAFLGRADGSWPPLWDFFKESIRSPSLGWIQTEGGYGLGTSLVRIPVPAGARGRFTLVLADMAGNQTTFFGQISP